MGQSRLQSNQCRAILTHDDIRLDAAQPEHFLGAEAFFKGYPHWMVDLARRLATVLGAIRAVHDQRGLCAGRRAAIDLNQGGTNERYSNIVHPLVSCDFERRQNAYCSAIRGYCLVHRCCDLDRLGHGAIAGASISGRNVAVQASA